MSSETTTCQCKCSKETEEQKYERVNQIIDEYKDMEGSLIQILHLAQGIFGYLPEKLMRLISDRVKIPLNEIYGVVTFYEFFSTRPKGENTIRVCMGTACYVKGSKDVLQGFSKELDVKVGGTTEDSKFTLEICRCIGACSLAPVVTVNGKVYQKVDPKKIKDILEEY